MGYNRTGMESIKSVLQDIKDTCNRVGLFLGCVESMTAGRLTAAFGSIPGASSFLKGGIVAYRPEVKARLLGIPSDILKDPGPVSSITCEYMLKEGSKILESTITLATTGYAGPPQGDEEVGLVFLGIKIHQEVEVIRAKFSGSREEIQDQAVKKLVLLLWERLKRKYAHL